MFVVMMRVSTGCSPVGSAIYLAQGKRRESHGRVRLRPRTLQVRCGTQKVSGVSVDGDIERKSSSGASESARFFHATHVQERFIHIYIKI